MYSCPLEKSQVDLSAIEQVWHAKHRLILNTKANCHFGCRSSYGYSIFRPSCQLYTSGIVHPPSSHDRLVCPLSSCSIVFKPQAVSPLHLDLDVFAFEPLDHELVLLARR